MGIFLVMFLKKTLALSFYSAKPWTIIWDIIKCAEKHETVCSSSLCKTFVIRVRTVKEKCTVAVMRGWIIHSATVGACSNHNACMFHCQTLCNGEDLWLIWKECQGTGTDWRPRRCQAREQRWILSKKHISEFRCNQQKPSYKHMNTISLEIITYTCQWL